MMENPFVCFLFYQSVDEFDHKLEARVTPA